MFFIFSKLFVFLISPLIWIVVLLAIAVFSKYPNRKRKCLRWAFILIVAFSNSFLFDECSRKWEIPVTAFNDLKSYQAGIVLGGMSVYDYGKDRAQFFRGVDRLIQAVELYRRGVIKKIIFTGGSGRLLEPEMKEGRYIYRYLLYMGIPKKDVYMEAESKNTYENALFTKQMIDREGVSGDFLLITSAMHMRRSIGCFSKVGIKTQAYSTDRYSGARKFELDHLFIPEPSVLYNWTTLLHEIVGYGVYKIVGYI